MKKIAIQLKFIWYKYKFVQYKWNIYKTNKLSYTLYNRNEREKKNSNRNYRIQINTKEHTWKLQTTNKIVYNTNGTVFDMLVFVTQKTCSVH